jgi:hypothetical protein
MGARDELSDGCAPVWTVKGKAVAVAEHKLTRLTYAMLTKGKEYTDAGQDYFEERYRERVLRNLTERGKKLRLKMILIEQAA